MGVVRGESSERDISARITDDDIAKYRMRIGVPYGRPKSPHNLEAHADSMRHFAWGYGDDNPLYSDPEYAKQTRWGGIIAAPLYLLTMGENEAGDLPAELRAKTKGALVGVHVFYAGSEHYFYRPVRQGDRLVETAWMTDVVEKASRISDGRRSLVVHWEHEYQHATTRTVYAMTREWAMHVERSASATSGKERDIPEPHYTPDEIEAIDRHLLAEGPRGAIPRYWDDVEVGDEVPTLLKGPFCVSDTVAFHIGWGVGGDYSWGPLRLAAKRRQEIRGFYSRDSRGAWDVVQRLHWDESWARRIGLARPYDYGPQRTVYMAHALTDWMGDDGWLFRLRSEIRGFNYIGDLTSVSGRVAEKPERGQVELQLACTNQRGEVTASGTATVFLPSRSDGPPPLPRPPARRWRSHGAPQGSEL